VILVYDVTSRESFDNLKNTWLPELETYASSKSVIKMIVGNKIDKTDSRAVTKKEGMDFAMENGALFLECSAKTKVGVQQAFEELCWKVYETPLLWKKRMQGGGPGSGPLNLADASTVGQTDGCAC
jgi:Ras-related protein Rab-18